jgi:hypothetical protein
VRLVDATHVWLMVTEHVQPAFARGVVAVVSPSCLALGLAWIRGRAVLVERRVNEESAF